DYKFACSSVRQDPDDGDDGERGHNFHAGKVKRQTVGADVAVDQKPAGGAAEKIHQEDSNVGKHGQVFESSGHGERKRERGVSDGLLTSPHGISATSIPTKTKINKMTASPKGLLPGQPVKARFGG